MEGWSSFQGGQVFFPIRQSAFGRRSSGEHLPERLASVKPSTSLRSPKAKTFFAYVSFTRLHTPLMAPAALVAKYRQKARKLGLDRQEVFQPEEQVWPNAKSPRRVRSVQSHATYAAMVESMDSQVGRVLDALTRLGIADHTIVCFTSDNGGLSTSEESPTSNLPLRGGKGWLYEGGIREPYLIKWPSMCITPEKSSSYPVSSVDFYPTLLELAGLPLKPDQHLDGVSLVPLLEGKTLPSSPCSGTTRITAIGEVSPGERSVRGPGRRSNDMRMEQFISIIFLMIQVRLMISQVNTLKNLPL